MSSNTPVLWPIWIERGGGGAVQGFKVQCRIDRNRTLDVCKFLVETLHLGASNQKLNENRLLNRTEYLFWLRAKHKQSWDDD